ncbi:hypothetical protein AB0E63_02165 [Kribbella sp. NPDC026596]|uniref:hypothetical protein n=1 Tax=Kribbella sp. NPDC026596 TaxID=3155122 RepID=UPI0033EC8BA0
MTKTTGLPTTSRISNLPGLSPHGRVVIARLENTRLQPGQVREAIDHWERFVRDPAHRLYDPRYEGCGIWECCPPVLEVRAILHVVEGNLPRRDARRLRARLDVLDECWRHTPPRPGSP